MEENNLNNKEELKKYLINLRNSILEQQNKSQTQNNSIKTEEELENRLTDTSNDLRINKPKTKVRKLEQSTNMNNAAFTKVGFLVINILTFILLITTIILLNK